MTLFKPQISVWLVWLYKRCIFCAEHNYPCCDLLAAAQPLPWHSACRWWMIEAWFPHLQESLLVGSLILDAARTSFITLLWYTWSCTYCWNKVQRLNSNYIYRTQICIYGNYLSQQNTQSILISGRILTHYTLAVSYLESAKYWRWQKKKICLKARLNRVGWFVISLTGCIPSIQYLTFHMKL